MNRFLIFLFVILLAAVAGAAEKPKKKLMDNYIAVFDLETQDVDKKISRPLTESIRRELVTSGKYEVIDRGNMDKILGEQALQMTGCVAGECVVEAGKLLGVGKIITGSVSIIGKTYYLSLSLINVQSGKIEKVSEDKRRCEIDDLIDSSKTLARRLLGLAVEEEELLTSKFRSPTTVNIRALQNDVAFPKLRNGPMSANISMKIITAEGKGLPIDSNSSAEFTKKEALTASLIIALRNFAESLKLTKNIVAAYDCKRDQKNDADYLRFHKQDYEIALNYNDLFDLSINRPLKSNDCDSFDWLISSNRNKLIVDMVFDYDEFVLSSRTIVANFAVTHDLITVEFKNDKRNILVNDNKLSNPEDVKYYNRIKRFLQNNGIVVEEDKPTNGPPSVLIGYVNPV